MTTKEFWYTFGKTYMELVFIGGEEDKYGYFEQELLMKKDLKRIMERLKRTYSKYSHIVTAEIKKKIDILIKEAEKNKYEYDDEANTMLLIGTTEAYCDSKWKQGSKTITSLP